MSKFPKNLKLLITTYLLPFIIISPLILRGVLERS